MISIDQLKELVLKNVEQSGQMDYIRAQLKLQDNKEQVGFQWEHPLKKVIHNTQDGLSALQLIGEFLEYYKLDYTSQVFRKETHLIEPIIRPRLAKQIGISGKEDSLKPLLLTLIFEYMKCLEEGVPSPGKKASVKVPEKGPEDEENLQKKKELEWKREQERKREEDLKKKEEEDKKREEEKKKKQQQQQGQRPQTAPPEQKPKGDTGGPVNKIRGAGKITGMAGNLSNLYGLDQASKASNDVDNYAFDLETKQGGKNPYAFDMGGNDPYAFDLDSKKTDPYAFDLDGAKKKGDANKKSDPYSFDLEAGKKGKEKNKFNSNAYEFELEQPKANVNNKRQAIKEEIDEEIDFAESKDDRQKQSNNMFTSSEDYMRATQSLGVDESVDSLALEEYDYYEDVTKKR